MPGPAALMVTRARTVSAPPPRPSRQARAGDAPVRVARQRGGRDVVGHRRAVREAECRKARTSRSLLATWASVHSAPPVRPSVGKPGHARARPRPATGGGRAGCECASSRPRLRSRGQRRRWPAARWRRASRPRRPWPWVGTRNGERAHQRGGDAQERATARGPTRAPRRRRPAAGGAARRGSSSGCSSSCPPPKSPGLDQRHPQPAQAASQAMAAPLTPAADDQDVVLARGERAEVALQGFLASAFTTRVRRALSSSGICLNSKPTS